MTIARPTTADELARLEPTEDRTELLRGELHRMAPAGGEHGMVALEVGARMRNHVVAGGFGTVFAAETGFLLARDPDTVLAPDVAFVRAGRLPPHQQLRGFVPVVPDLVAEVVSPTDRPAYVQAKVEQELAAGVPLVWVFDSGRRRVRVHRPGRPAVELGEDDTLDGDDALPGFLLPLREIFG